MVFVDIGVEDIQKGTVNETALLNPKTATFGGGGERQPRKSYVTSDSAFVGEHLVNEDMVARDMDGM